MNKEPLRLIGLAVAGLAVGYGIGFVTTRARITKQYEEFIANDLAEIKEQYESGLRRSNYISPEEAVADRIGPDAVVFPEDGVIVTSPIEEPNAEEISEVQRIVEDAGYTIPAAPVEHNVFVNGTPLPIEDDDEDENPNRNPANEPAERPYVITQMLYHENDPDIRKEVLNYYSDGILADDADHRLDDIDAVVGKDNLEKFGQSSGDPDIVYVRNERLGADIEITRIGRTFHEVTGTDEDAPNAKPPVMRMREEDAE